LGTARPVKKSLARIQAALGGTVATTILEGDRQFGVAVRYPLEYRDSIEKIRDIKVASQSSGGANAYIPLSELATITLDTGASWIYHESGERFIPVKFSVRGRDLGGTVAEAQARIAKNAQLPPGYRLVWSGEFGELQSAKQRLEIIVPVSLVLILGLLYSLFNSIRECLLSLAGIPFTAAGGVLALYFSGINFSISAAIGFISLFGVSVMIGILLITHYNQARLRGGAPNDAMFSAASGLMRPLLMMSLSAGIGLFPAAISTGIGSEVQRPLATVVVGGMLFGSIMLLLVVPALKIIFLGGNHKPAAMAESK
jgi:cobalt-zinc-cadmium resistance protein CzcA